MLLGVAVPLLSCGFEGVREREVGGMELREEKGKGRRREGRGERERGVLERVRA